MISEYNAGNLVLMLRAFTIVYREELAVGTRLSSLLRSLAALRIIFFPKMVSQLESMQILTKLYNPKRKHDPLYFLAHKYYVSKRLTLRQRVQTALNHHKYELEAFSAEYARQVYRADGVILWERFIDKLHFTMVLIATPDNRYEGDLTVLLSVNDVRLCRMSFCYLNADIFGQSPSMTMLIARNQTDQTPSRDLFDQCFKQNSPQLFCLSAVCGIAMANGFKTVFAIKHDAQIAYEECLDSGFRNSYSALWEKFDATEVDRRVYMLNVPLKLRPLGSVNRVHRGRARARRGYWDEIAHSARASMIEYRKLPSSDEMFEAASLKGPRQFAAGASAASGADR
jgi:uncharacterized protein VirK/YbjX